MTAPDHVVRVRRASASGLLALTAATAVFILADVHTPVRLLVTLAFVVLAPGWAVAAFVRPARPSLIWITAVGVGISASIVIAQVMVNLHQWNPASMMLALAGVTAPLLVHHLLRDGRWDTAGGSAGSDLP